MFRDLKALYCTVHHSWKKLSKLLKSLRRIRGSLLHFIGDIIIFLLQLPVLFFLILPEANQIAVCGSSCKSLLFNLILSFFSYLLLGILPRGCYFKGKRKKSIIVEAEKGIITWAPVHWCCTIRLGDPECQDSGHSDSLPGGEDGLRRGIPKDLLHSVDTVKHTAGQVVSQLA